MSSEEHKMILKSVSIFTVLFLTIILFGCKQKDNVDPPATQEDKNVLVLTETQGFRHASISNGWSMFSINADQWNIKLTETKNSTMFTDESLKDFDIVVLLSTTGDVFSDDEQVAFQNFVEQGGAVLGIHAAADAEYDWPWYVNMLGAWFDNHPAIQEATCNAVSDHISVSGLPQTWVRTDEWYNFKNIATDNNVVVTIDETTYSGGTNGVDHPISWYRTIGDGKVFYTAMGHTEESYTDPLFVQHIRQAIKWLSE